MIVIVAATVVHDNENIDDNDDDDDDYCDCCVCVCVYICVCICICICVFDTLLDQRKKTLQDHVHQYKHCTIVLIPK